MFTFVEGSNCLTVLARVALPLFVSVAVAIGWVTTCEAQVREVARLALGDVARATTDRRGRPVVAYNPAACARLGPEMCEFVRAHEYGHIALGHLYDGTPGRRAEAEADCWAAKNASPAAVRAASNYFNRGYFGSRTHGSGPQRARRVAGCRGGAKKVLVRRARPAAGRTVSIRSTTSPVVRTFAAQPRSMRVVRTVPVRSTATQVIRSGNARPARTSFTRTVSPRSVPVVRVVRSVR